jgi:hypothetical protein
MAHDQGAGREVVGMAVPTERVGMCGEMGEVLDPELLLRG